MTRFLQAAAQNRADLTIEDFSASQIRWVIASGLAPLLVRCIANTSHPRTSPLWPSLKGADLAARMIHAEQMEAMEEITQACEGQVRPLTLLKGISVSEQFYPDPYLRPMRDIDFLVEQNDVPIVESILLRLGYHRRSENPQEFYEAHHHTTPFFHSQKKVWVEVHRALQPRQTPIGLDKVFSADVIKSERRPAEFRGRPVNRLSNELQVVYLASHWAFDLKLVGGMVAMIDLIYLLKTAQTICWSRILDWVDGAIAATPLYLLLTYLDRHGVVELPPGFVGELSLRQRSVGRTSLRILHAMIDRYITNGSDFGLLVSERNFRIVWNTLLLPSPPSRRFLVVFWHLLPSRGWLARSMIGCKHR